MHATADPEDKKRRRGTRILPCTQCEGKEKARNFSVMRGESDG
jgi:hypothetical protein